MIRNYDRELKNIFPPTPQVFAISMEATLRALPRNERRWKMPRLSLAAYALAACAVFTGVFVFAVSPAIAPPKSSHPAVAPTPSKLPQANQSIMKAADGWQIVAVAGDTQWYFNPRSGDIGRTGPYSSHPDTAAVTPEAYVYASDGSIGAYATSPGLIDQAVSESQWQTATFKLNIPAGWTVDPYTFLPSSGGRWVAFTVHGPKGDDVWIVTQDGRKMSVPDDVLWIDDSNRPIQADFSGARLVPMSNDDRYLSEKDLCGSSDNGLMMRATLANGDIYLVQVLLNTNNGNAECLLDDKRGIYEYAMTPTAGQVMLNTREFLYIVTRDGSGAYTIKGSNGQYHANLQSTDLAMVRFPERTGDFFSPEKVLVVYAGDATKTLWELNLATGTASKIASGCVAADWVDGNTYWYSVQPDSAAILERTAGNTDITGEKNAAAVEEHVTMGAGPGIHDSEGVISVSCNAWITVTLHNRTDDAVNIPLEMPCALTLSADGKSVWSKNGFALSDAENIELVDGNGNNIMPENRQLSAESWVAIPPEGILEIYLPEIPCDFSGTYTLDGTFYNQDPIHIVYTVDNTIKTPQGVIVRGELSSDRILTVAMENASPETFIPPRSSAQAGTLFVQYRIMSGGNVVCSQEKAPLTPLPNNIAPGGSFTMSTAGALPQIAGLRAGQYTLQCCVFDDPQYSLLPWGFIYGYYFEVPFTVPGK